MVSNSLFRAPCSKQNTLLLVPHEDDEINTAWALICLLVSAGADVTVAYTTNGDWKYSTETRIREAIKANSLLGINEDRLIFLGYGDAFNNDRHDHLFYHQSSPAVSASGHSETYGWGEYQDFAYRRNGAHHAYTAENYLADLIAVIEELRPSMIVCTDFDEHPDHRMLSLYVERAVGIIRKRDPSFCPLLWKGLAYACAYTAVPDYAVLNNPETQKPRPGITQKYAYDLAGLSHYDWDSRIRIPILEFARIADLRKNIIARALSQHRSQYIITHADRIINSDEVFFSRRTDNLAVSASIRTTSGDGRYLNDFLLYSVDDVDAGIPEFTGFWRPESKDAEKSAVFSWPRPVSIKQIVIYGAISADSGIHDLELALDDGTNIHILDLPGNGNPVKVDFPEKHSVNMCRLKILSAYGEHYGLSECEFYSEPEQKQTFPSFCKLLIGDNFAYDYVVKDERKLSVNLYQYGDTGPIKIFVKQGQAKLEDGVLQLDPAERSIILRAENPQGNIWDEISITRASEQELTEFRKLDKANKRYLARMSRAYKIHNMLYILKKQGPYSVMERTVKNVIKPGLRKLKHGNK